MSESLADTLQELQDANGLEMAAVVGTDGVIIDSASSHGIDAESVAAVAASGLMVMEAIGREVGDTHAQMTTIEYATKTLLVAPLSDDSLLVLLSGPNANLGRLRLAMRRSVDGIRQAVG